MRGGIGAYILIILLVLMLFGLISLGDVISVVFYVIVGFIVLVLAAVLFFRYKIGRLRKQMERDGETYRGYTWGAGSRAREEKRADGEVTVQQTETSKTKAVRSEVGDYVEYEEVAEEQKEATEEQ